MLGALNWQAALRPIHDTPHPPKLAHARICLRARSRVLKAQTFTPPYPRSIFT